MLQIYFILCMHRLGLLTLEDSHYRAFHILFQGKKRSDWSDFLPKYLDEEWDNVVSSAVLSRLSHAQKRGEVTALYSSGPDFIVESIAKRFKINYVESSKYEVDKEGRFVKISSLLDGDGKDLALRRLARESGVPLCNVTAYSDSILDLPLLRTAGRAVCVAPDRQLKRYAQKQGWEIINHGNTI